MTRVGFEQLQHLEFIDEIRTSVIERCIAESAEAKTGLFRAEAFTEIVSEQLADIGQLGDTEICHVDARAGRYMVRTSAWGLDSEEGRLELVSTIFRDSFANEAVPAREVEKAVRQAANALRGAAEVVRDEMEPSSPVFDMYQKIAEVSGGLSGVRVVVIVDGQAKNLDIEPFDVEGIPVLWDIWDYERLYRAVTAGLPYEAILIDIEERLGECLPCLKAPGNGRDYDCYMAVIPGKLIHELYQEFGPRLLELNVRSFLQARGKVNKGIRDTLKNDAKKFLAYNNGLSITAEEIVTVERPDRQLGIQSIKGLQVVNGGQTVASIHRAKARDGSDLAQVAVQAKITIVERDQVETLVPAISRYANTQNRVNEADLSANHPFHVLLQQLSESTWSPGEQSRWFYERARGQYEVARNREGTTPARRRAFDQKTPRAQRFDKVAVGKYVNSWRKLPHIVSRGAQKNFTYFMDELRRIHGAEFEPDIDYFKDLIAKGILYKRAEKVARMHAFPGYRANAVTYTLAMLSHRTAGRLSLKSIWEAQEAGGAVADLIYAWMPLIYDEIVGSAGGKNVTEWCKKEECWRTVQTMNLHVSDEVKAILADGEALPTVGAATGRSGGGLTDQDRENIARVMTVPAVDWINVVEASTRNESLKGWQRGIATTLASYAAEGWVRVPSKKQASHGVTILAVAEELGWLGVIE
jgi:hypothetical protein